MEEEIPFIEIEVKLINDCTDLTHDKWIAIYAKRFRDIVEADPTLNEHQIKHALYLQK